MPDERKIEHNFTYHPPSDEKKLQHETLRGLYKELALWVDKNVPDSREKSLAITKLEESLMWANAAVAREPRPEA